MKALLLILISIVLFGCSTDNSAIETSSDKIKEIKKSKAVRASLKIPHLDVSQLKGKVFDTGSRTHFTDSCKFDFACDCCSGILILNPDLTFYTFDYCQGDETVSNGKYSIKNNLVLIEYSGLHVLKRYNWENETDTSAVDYLINDTITQGNIIRYSPEMCDKKLMLIANEGDELALENKDEYNSLMQKIKEEGLINRFDNIK